MKSIGITTHYTNSCNYGGLLQSYALCKVLNDMGFDAKQIQYYHKTIIEINKIIKSLKYGNLIRKAIKKLSVSINNKAIDKESNNQDINVYGKTFMAFRDRIPHTNEIYTTTNINKCTEFDIYITGSDQVWPVSEDTVDLDIFYWLKFVNNKRKISYAASIGTRYIPSRLNSQITDALSDYSAISVRQKHDKEMLDAILPNKEISWVLDPTLLMDRSVWENDCDENPYTNEKYIFTYFLGDSCEDRQFAERIAQHLNLKIINIPYLLKRYRKCDDGFGDIRLSDVSPKLWISLIRDAQYVFTDSFHCVAFSLIFNKEFFAFKRFKDNERNSINSRIESLLSLIDCEERIISNTVSYEEFQNIDMLDYKKIDEIINTERKKSIQFLSDALELSV